RGRPGPGGLQGPGPQAAGVHLRPGQDLPGLVARRGRCGDAIPTLEGEDSLVEALRCHAEPGQPARNETVQRLLERLKGLRPPAVSPGDPTVTALPQAFSEATLPPP